MKGFDPTLCIAFKTISGCVSPLGEGERLNGSSTRVFALPLTLHPHGLIHHRGLLENNSGPSFQTPLHSQVHKTERKITTSCNSSAGSAPRILRRARCHSVNFPNERRPHFQSYRLWGEGTKCKRFDQIDLLSRSPTAVRPSLSRASAGGHGGDLGSLICVIVGGGMQNESSIIHSGRIQQVIACCCIASAPTERFIHLHVRRERP